MLHCFERSSPKRNRSCRETFASHIRASDYTCPILGAKAKITNSRFASLDLRKSRKQQGHTQKIPTKRAILLCSDELIEHACAHLQLIQCARQLKVLFSHATQNNHHSPSIIELSALCKTEKSFGPAPVRKDKGPWLSSSKVHPP